MKTWIFDLATYHLDVDLFFVNAYTYEGALFRLRRHFEAQLGLTENLDKSVRAFLVQVDEWEQGTYGETEYFESNDVGVVHTLTYELD